MCTYIHVVWELLKCMPLMYIWCMCTLYVYSGGSNSEVKCIATIYMEIRVHSTLAKKVHIGKKER